MRDSQFIVVRAAAFLAHIAVAFTTGLADKIGAENRYMEGKAKAQRIDRSLVNIDVCHMINCRLRRQDRANRERVRNR